MGPAGALHEAKTVRIWGFPAVQTRHPLPAVGRPGPVRGGRMRLTAKNLRRLGVAGSFRRARPRSRCVPDPTRLPQPRHAVAKRWLIRC